MDIYFNGVYNTTYPYAAGVALGDRVVIFQRGDESVVGFGRNAYTDDKARLLLKAQDMILKFFKLEAVPPEAVDMESMEQIDITGDGAINNRKLVRLGQMSWCETTHTGRGTIVVRGRPGAKITIAETVYSLEHVILCGKI